MSEITDDYRGNDNVHRYGPINAKASELSGTGTIADEYGWLITEDSLPDELIDSDEATSEASGGGTIRFSTDEFGSNQLDITVSIFTPASGGASGGAEAEIWLDIGSYTGGTAKPVYVWWITGGSQTQTSTAFNAHTAAFNAVTDPDTTPGDMPDDSPNNNDGSTIGTMAALTTGPGSIKKEWPFDGANDEVEYGDFDVANSIFLEFWLNATNTTSRRAIVGKHDASGVNEVVLLFWETGALTSIVRTSVQTTGTSNTGDTHWIVQFEESGANTITRWYKDGVLHLTQTHTSTLIGAVSGGQDWRWGQEWDGAVRSDYWLGSMAAMRLVEAAPSDLADIAATHYSNQNNAANFWDTASAAYAAGPFNDIPTYQFTHISRDRTWTGGIYENGYSGSTSTICAGQDMVVTWGRRTNTLDSRMRASELRFDIYDPDFTIYNYLTDSTKSESDFYFLLTDSTSTYTLKMRIRLDELETMLVPNLRQQITRVYCYCGLAEMKNIDAITATSNTFGEIVSGILISNAVSQDIEIVSMHYPKNIASTGVLWNLMRLNRLDLIFIDDGRKKHNMYDQLKGIAEGFGLTVFTGLDGQWHMKHEYALGDTLTSKRGAMKYSVNSGAFTTLNTITGNVFSLVNRTVSGGAMKRPIPAIQAVEVTRGNPASSKFITVDLLRFGDFEEGWESSTEHCSWQNVVRSTDSDTGTYAGRIDEGIIGYQDIPRFSGSQNIDFELALRIGVTESALAAGQANRTVQFSLYHLNTVTDGLTPIGYGQPDGWSESIALIAFSTTSVGLLSTPIYSTFITAFRGPLFGEDGFFRLNINPLAGVAINVYVDSVELRMKNGDNAQGQFIGVNALYDNDNVIINSGEVVEQRVQWFNGLLGLDPEDDGTRNTVHEMMQALTTSAGTWVQMAEFNSEVINYAGNEYPDPFELMSDIRIAQQDETIEQIEGELLGIAPPDYVIRYNSKDYIQVYTEIDLFKEITSFVATEKKIGAIETLAITDIWITLEETGSSTGPDNYIARFDVPDDITSVPWDTDAAQWDSGNIYERAGGTPMEHITADIASDALFFRDTASFYLYKTKLDGSGVVTSAIPMDGGIALDRVQKKVYIYNFTALRIEEYDYDLNFVRAIYSKPGGTTNIGGLSLDINNANLYFAEQNVLSGSNDFFYRINLATLIKTQVLNITTLGISGFGALESSIDDDENKLFFASGTSIYSSALTGGSINTILTPGNAAFCLNRKDKKIVYGDGNGDTYQADYDGSNSERVLDWNSAYEVGSLTLGQD